MNEPDVTGGKAEHDKGPKEANYPLSIIFRAKKIDTVSPVVLYSCLHGVHSTPKNA